MKITKKILLSLCISASLLTVPLNDIKYNVTAIDNPFHSDITIGDLSYSYIYSTFQTPGAHTQTLAVVGYSGNETEITIPEEINGIPVIGIDDEAFKNNNTIKKITLPDSMYYFGNSVFENSSLESINIPESLRIIPKNTFTDCTNLKDVKFHDNIIAADASAFSGTSIEIPKQLNISSGNEFLPITCFSTFELCIGDIVLIVLPLDLGKKYVASLCAYPITEADLTIPESIEGIEIYTVSLEITDDKLTSLTFPPCVQDIYIDIKEAKNLKKIEIQGELKGSDSDPAEETFSGSNDNMVSGALGNWSPLKKVISKTNSNKITIYDEAFYGCTSLEEVILPDNCDVDIKASAFCNTGIKELVIDGNLKTEYYCFKNCKDLKNVVVKGDAYFDKGCFEKCNSLKNLTVEGTMSAESDTFSGCGLSNINIDISKDIDGKWFSRSPELKTINSVSPVDDEKADFKPGFKDFIMRNFYGVENVGFINDFVMANVKKTVKENITADMSDVQKAKVLHDWVCSNTVYEYDNKSFAQLFTDAGVFFYGSTQCQGYANAFNLLMHEAGIETYVVNSDSHAWNIIKLGGHYFHVDTTWDDFDTGTDDWFLKSDKEVAEESSSHASWAARVPSALHSFQKSELPECIYSMGDVNMDENTNIADLVSLQRHVLGQASIAQDDQILGDLCSDGILDGFDIIKMRRAIIKNINRDDGK